MSITTAVAQNPKPFLATVPGRLAAPALLRKLEAIRGLGIFAGVADAELLKLAEASLLRRFERGRTVFQGGTSEECVMLVEGRVKTTMPRGIASGEFVLAFHEAGDIVSDGCWAHAAPPVLVETVALEPTLAIFLPRRSLDLLLSRNANLALRFVEAIATKLHRVIDLAVQNSCLEVGDRLYRRLVELGAARGTRTCGGVLIEHGLYQSELAAGIGASREAVNRQLATWRDLGLVEAGRRFVLVKDPLGLSMTVSRAVRGMGIIGAKDDPR